MHLFNSQKNKTMYIKVHRVSKAKQSGVKMFKIRHNLCELTFTLRRQEIASLVSLFHMYSYSYLVPVYLKCHKTYKRYNIWPYFSSSSLDHE